MNDNSSVTELSRCVSNTCSGACSEQEKTMELTGREFWTLIHGMVLGATFLLGFGGGFAGLYSYTPEWLTREGIRERFVRLDVGTGLMALASWLTVITGTWIVYPWYRARPPAELAGAVDNYAKTGQALSPEQLSALQNEFPRWYLLAQEKTALWHEFGMEWKEHVAWISPLLATVVFFAVLYYGPRLAYAPRSTSSEARSAASSTSTIRSARWRVRPPTRW